MSEENSHEQFHQQVNSLINAPPETLQEAQNQSSNHATSHYDKSFNFENCNSLALAVRQSIENGIPIPFSMLSRSEDAFQL